MPIDKKGDERHVIDEVFLDAWGWFLDPTNKPFLAIGSRFDRFRTGSEPAKVSGLKHRMQAVQRQVFSRRSCEIFIEATELFLQLQQAQVNTSAEQQADSSDQE